MNNITQLAKEVKSLGQRNAKSRELFVWLAARVKNSRETTIERMALKVKLEHTDLLDILRIFEHLGLGTFVTGRRGHKSRFVWEYSLTSIGKVGLAMQDELYRLGDDPGDEEDEEEVPITAKAREVSQLIRMGDTQLDLAQLLPKILTKQSAKQLAAVLEEFAAA